MRLPMRSLLVAAVVAIMSCANGPPQPAGDGYDQFGCKISCNKCPPQALCVGVPYVASCIVECASSADCDNGLTCAVIDRPGGVRVCIGPGSLMLCEPSTCSNPPQCLNDSTQLKPLPAGFSSCGWEPIHCDSGCDSATGSCK
jgi:hypothetical protein